MTLHRCWILSWEDLWSHLLRFFCSILAVLLYLPFPGTAALCYFLSHVVCVLLLLSLVLLACFSICFIDALIIIVKYFRTFLAKRVVQVDFYSWFYDILVLVEDNLFLYLCQLSLPYRVDLFLLCLAICQCYYIFFGRKFQYLDFWF